MEIRSELATFSAVYASYSRSANTFLQPLGQYLIIFMDAITETAGVISGYRCLRL